MFTIRPQLHVLREMKLIADIVNYKFSRKLFATNRRDTSLLILSNQLVKKTLWEQCHVQHLRQTFRYFPNTLNGRDCLVVLLESTVFNPFPKYNKSAADDFEKSWKHIGRMKNSVWLISPLATMFSKVVCCRLLNRCVSPSIMSGRETWRTDTHTTGNRSCYATLPRQHTSEDVHNCP